ncbi:MAG TPA: M48 family metallopeptidase [Nitrospirales bacterium]|jgi:predicted Zn-dependent protease
MTETLPPRLQTAWTGHYYDGRTPTRQSTTIILAPTGLELQLANGTRAYWAYRDVAQTQGAYANEPVRLERLTPGQQIPEALVIEDRAFLQALTVVSKGHSRQFAAAENRRSRLILAAVGSVAALAVLIVWGIPALAEFITPFVPVSWEVALGQSVASELAPASGRCTSSKLQNSLNTIVARLVVNGSPKVYDFHITVLDSPIFNAFAAPGGYIVIYRPLLEATNTPDELAGVLAHEMQHVLQRHATKGLVRDLSLSLLVGAILGDVSGAGAFGVQAARRLAILHYSRATEEQADQEGMALIHAAHIDPQGMVAFFTTLEDHAAGVEPPAYLSTHPDSNARIAALKKIASGYQSEQPTSLLPNDQWNELKKLCR